MANLSDETLMAFADGELAPGERARVEAALVADATGRARLEIFIVTGRSLADQFRKPLIEPVPRRLVDLVLDRSVETAHSVQRWPKILMPRQHGSLSLVSCSHSLVPIVLAALPVSTMTAR